MIANGVIKDANNLGSSKVDSLLNLCSAFESQKLEVRSLFCAFDRVCAFCFGSCMYAFAFIVLWNVYGPLPFDRVCVLLPPSYRPSVSSFLAFTFFSMELLFCNLWTYWQITTCQKNQLSLSMWWKISEIRFALLSDCMFWFSITDPIAETSSQSHFPALFDLFLVIRFQVNTRNHICLPLENCLFYLSLCSFFDLERSGKIERDIVFAFCAIWISNHAERSNSTKADGLHWNCAANLTIISLRDPLRAKSVSSYSIMIKPLQVPNNICCAPLLHENVGSFCLGKSNATTFLSIHDHPKSRENLSTIPKDDVPINHFVDRSSLIFQDPHSSYLNGNGKPETLSCFHPLRSFLELIFPSWKIAFLISEIQGLESSTFHWKSSLLTFVLTSLQKLIVFFYSKKIQVILVSSALWSPEFDVLEEFSIPFVGASFFGHILICFLFFF